MYSVVETIERCQQRFVGQLLMRLAGECHVDVRRLAVGNRMADDGVTLCGLWWRKSQRENP
jgi:hypothetical protein